MTSPNKTEKNTAAVLLESAAEVFVEKGFNGARMQEIADKAGVNKALLHYYFSTKSNLYEEVIRFQFKRNFALLLLELRLQDSFEYALKGFINGYIDLLAANPEIPKFMLRELADGGQAVAKVLGEMLLDEQQPTATGLKRLLNRSVRQGEINRVDLAQLIMTVIGACIYSFIGSPIIEVFMPEIKEEKRQKFLDARKRAVFRTIYYGVKKRNKE